MAPHAGTRDAIKRVAGGVDTATMTTVMYQDLRPTFCSGLLLT
jgi:hypothetical protein